MSLTDIDLRLQYRSDRDNLVKDFYVPCMNESIVYDMAVGYFTNNSLVQATKGIERFLEHDGKIRMIASPKLSEEDIIAIQAGVCAKADVIESVLIKEMEPNEYNIKNSAFNILAWLIYTNKLEIKIALMKESDVGIYHEKFGIFKDKDGSRIAFTGSTNETEGGLVNIFESFDVYFSHNERDSQRIQIKENDFENLWLNRTRGLEVYEFPEACKLKLLEFKSIETNPNSSGLDSKLKINDINVPYYLDIRDYQNQAIKAWLSNGGKGILEMATGTGKTITSLYLISKVHNKLKKLAIIIVCPYQHLVSQWNSEAKQFNINSILCFGNKLDWQENLVENINNYNMNILNYLSVITTNSTFCTENFKSFVESINQPVLIIFDEAHHVGTDNFLKYLPHGVRFRLGLSATPDRWFDEEGNKIIEDYFGGKVFSFPLENAIGKFLTDYYYYPHLVYFTDDESQEYYDLSSKIGKCLMFSKNRKEINNDQPQLKQLLIKRAKLIGKAENKILKLKECLKGKEKTKYNLFYTGDAKIDGERQIEKVIKMLGTELGMYVHPFTSEESKEERQKILEAYETGELQGLVAIKCLDEGVNIPLIQTAYILASSSNPREFIQRRGRVLRRHPLKQFSYIHDFIVIPRNIENLKNTDDRLFNIERNLMKKELARVSEFCNLSMNGPEALLELIQIKEAYNLLDL